MRLSDLNTGECGVITKILGHGAFRKRVLEMGFVRGREVTVLLHAPLQDPIKYRLMDYDVSLRRSESSLIEIVPISEWKQHEDNDLRKREFLEIDDCEIQDNSKIRQDKVINVALLGNPNCGKTSLFNHASGAS